ncbi:MAG TPA: DUF433 domain-containing protein [Polyangia bacterium]|nr:DUF433 domain-containing protein [Polyangia bacterium]
MEGQRDIRAFGIETAVRVSRLSVTQLRRWAKDGFFRPKFMSEDGFLLYSFRDLVALRTIAELRRRGVSRQALKELGTWLHVRYDDPWSTLVFSIEGRRPVFDDPNTGTAISSEPVGQALAREVIRLEQIAGQVERDVTDIRRRPPETIGKISARRGIQGGVRCIAGTRIPVAAIQELAASGMCAADIRKQFPSLTDADVEAALRDEHRTEPHRHAS